MVEGQGFFLKFSDGGAKFSDGGQNEGKGVVEGSIWGRGQWTSRDWVAHTHTHTSSCLSLKPVKQMTVFSMVQE